MQLLAIIALGDSPRCETYPCLCERRLVHYRSKVQLLEDAFDFMIELYAIEKDEEVQNSFNQADLILNATGVGMDSESLPIASHLTFPHRP